MWEGEGGAGGRGLRGSGVGVGDREQIGENLSYNNVEKFISIILIISRLQGALYLGIMIWVGGKNTVLCENILKPCPLFFNHTQYNTTA